MRCSPRWFVLAATLLATSLAAQEAQPWNLNRGLIDAEIDRAADLSDGAVRIGVWIGDHRGQVAYARHAEQVFPAASAIKTALMVEAFGAPDAALDLPPAELAALCADLTHPLWAPLSEELAARARTALSPLSLFALGDTAMRGTAVTNVTYNAAGSLLMAFAGGPEAATQAIASRSPRYSELVCRRYFLAARDAGDNTATPRALGALLSDLARGEVPGLSAVAADAARAVMLARRDPEFGVLYAKDGALATDPACRVRAEFYEDRYGTWVCVVMGSAEVGSDTRSELVSAEVERVHELVRERVVLARAGADADFARRSGFEIEPWRAAARPARTDGALRGASRGDRLSAYLGAQVGARVAMLDVTHIESALSIAEDVGPTGALSVADEQATLLRGLEIAATDAGLTQVQTHLRQRVTEAWRGFDADLALHAPEHELDADQRRAAIDALLLALAPGGVAVIVLEGAAMPVEAIARRGALQAWWDAAQAAGMERGRAWRFPRGAAFVLELRRPRD